MGHTEAEPVQIRCHDGFGIVAVALTTSPAPWVPSGGDTNASLDLCCNRKNDGHGVRKLVFCWLCDLGQITSPL